MSDMNTTEATCSVCGAVFQREVKPGRPATKCPDCRDKATSNTKLARTQAAAARSQRARSLPVVEKPVKEKKEPTPKDVQVSSRWAVYECPECKYKTTQLSAATEIMCIRKHLKAVRMVRIAAAQ